MTDQPDTPRQDLYQYSTLTRTTDPRNPTNLAIMLISAAALVGFFIIAMRGGVSFPQAALTALYGSGVVFVGWALSREIDPDHDYSAFAAVGVGVLGMFLINPFHTWVMNAESPLLSMQRTFNGLVIPGVLITALRAVNRSVGPRPKVGDSAFITLLALSGLLVGNVWAALAGAGALALDALLEPPNRREWPFVAVLLAAALGYSLLVAFPASGPDLPTVPLLATLTVSGLFLFAVFRYGQPAALSDARGEPLDPIRVKAAMLLTLGIALSATLWEGGVGLDETYVLWAAMAGVGLYGLVWMVRREE